MLRRPVSLTIVCLALACDPGRQAAAPSPAASEAELQEEPQPEPEPEPESKPGAGGATSTSTEIEVQPPLPPPTKAEAMAACRSVLSAKLAELAPLVALGPRRHAIALRERVADDPSAAALVVAILDGSGSEADPAAPVTWAVTSSLEVARIAGTGLEDGPPSLPTTLLVEDFDDDGELELKLRYREDVMCGGGGLNTITKLALLDVEPDLAIALATELHHTMEPNPTQTKAEVSHEDVDGDGHRDVRIRYTTTDEDGEQVAQNVWLWSQADRWRLRPAQTSDPTPGYDRWGCDW